MSNLTKKDLDTKDAIIDYINEYGYPPSIRDLCKIMDVASTSTIHSRLKKLKEAGVIETDKEISSRAIRVVGYRFVKDDKDESNNCNEKS